MIQLLKPELPPLDSVTITHFAKLARTAPPSRSSSRTDNGAGSAGLTKPAGGAMRIRDDSSFGHGPQRTGKCVPISSNCFERLPYLKPT
jgi:hypothetical protein